MKVLIAQFLNQRHSWANCGLSWAEALIDLGHQVELFPTDGYNDIPEKFKPYVIGHTNLNQSNIVFGRAPSKDYDCQISYTCMKNFPTLLGNGNKNRFGWWIYEWASKNVLPNGFAKAHKYCDILFSPSNFGKEVFLNSGVPEEKIKVLPHGINIEQYRQNSVMKLPTDKKFKILSVIQQNHSRKNIPGLLEAYGKAFTNKDDVCLVLKAKDKKVAFPFDVSLSKCLEAFYKKFPNHGELKIISEFVEDMSALYRSVDCVYTMSHCEGYYMPGTEALAAGKLNIAPNYGGQLDFLTEENSYLISGNTTRADPKSMYWESKNNAIWFEPSIDDAVEKLHLAHKNHKEINNKLESQREEVYKRHDWKTITKEMLNYCI